MLQVILYLIKLMFLEWPLVADFETMHILDKPWCDCIFKEKSDPLYIRPNMVLFNDINWNP